MMRHSHGASPSASASLLSPCSSHIFETFSSRPENIDSLFRKSNSWGWFRGTYNIQRTTLWITHILSSPVCGFEVSENKINEHLDSDECKLDSTEPSVTSSSQPSIPSSSQSQSSNKAHTSVKKPLAPIFGGGGNTNAAKRARDVPQAPKSTSGPRLPAIIDIDAPQAKRQKTATENLKSAEPLAARLRPTSLKEFVGQRHIVAPDSVLLTGNSSIILWGPPGCGKTTLARLIAHESGAAFKELSATSAGAAEARSVCEEAKNALKLRGRQTLLFLDEIHRFNRAQQDVLLPYVEAGHIRVCMWASRRAVSDVQQLIGATTENPSFKVNGALISRCRVFVLERLSDEDIATILGHALERHSTATQTDHVTISDAVRTTIVSLANGDARTALSLLELVLTSRTSSEITLLQSLKRSVATSYDRSGDDHYDLISALHKSVRGSDGSAALYWLARMLEGGEDPLYVARRLIVMASEDIGLADDTCLPLAIATHAACEKVGMPECRINLAHCVARFAEAPKSTRSYDAYNRAQEAVQKDQVAPVPLQIRNAPTALMKSLGYGDNYRYNPDYAHPVYNQFLPVEALDNAGIGENERHFLRPNEADARREKIWNNDLLEQWEWFENHGKPWEGRQQYQSKEQ